MPRRNSSTPAPQVPAGGGSLGQSALATVPQLAAQTGVTGQLLSFVVAFIPPPLVVFAGVVFILFHVLETYMTSEISTVDTRLRAAKASIEESKARAAAAAAGDGTIRLETQRAEVWKRQQEAAKLKNELDAQNATIDGETQRLANLRAQIAQKESQANLTRAAADAAMAREGVSTLEEKMARRKLMLTELEALQKAANGVIPNIMAPGGGPDLVNTICRNRYAGLIGCPASYVKKFAAVAEEPPPTPGKAALDAGSDRSGTVATELLNVRSCADASDRCGVIGRLPSGTRVNVINQLSNGWLEIDAGSTHGFVNGRMIQMGGPL